MKTYPGIDYGFRPESYWGVPDPLALILRHVKGSNRRKMITDFWRDGRLKELDDSLLKDTLADEERRQLARVHPSFMGGEYLPAFRPAEQEVVRIQLQSVTADVISIRARRLSRGIGWRVVDEYPEDGEEYVIRPKVTRRPLTLAGLITLIDGATYSGYELEGGLALGWTNYNFEGGDSCAAEELRDFTSVESEFYPQLKEHYAHVFDEWVEEHGGEDEDGDEEDAE